MLFPCSPQVLHRTYRILSIPSILSGRRLRGDFRDFDVTVSVAVASPPEVSVLPADHRGGTMTSADFSRQALLRRPLGDDVRETSSGKNTLFPAIYPPHLHLGSV